MSHCIHSHIFKLPEMTKCIIINMLYPVTIQLPNHEIKKNPSFEMTQLIWYKTNIYVCYIFYTLYLLY